MWVKKFQRNVKGVVVLSQSCIVGSVLKPYLDDGWLASKNIRQIVGVGIGNIFVPYVPSLR